MRATLPILALCLLAACAADTTADPDPDPEVMEMPQIERSGLDANLRVGELGPIESRVLCEWQAETMDFVAGEILCDDGRTVSLRSIEACVQADTATTCPMLTVGQVEDCAIVSSADPCNVFRADECRPAMECPGGVRP